MTARNLWPHQAETLAKMGNVLYDMSDPGTGKTLVQLVNYERRSSPGRALVLCPKTLMQSAWGNDIEHHKLPFSYVTAYAKNREAAFRSGADMVITNIDAAVTLAKDPSLLKGFDHLIIDEITAYKHRTSARSKAVAKIRKQFKYRYGMSGTPNPNSVTELHHQILLLDDGKRLGTSFTAFRNNTQVAEQIGPLAAHVRWTDMPGKQDVVYYMLRDITVRHAFEDVMTQVPANHRNYKDFKLTNAALKVYKQLEAECILAISNTAITAVHAAALRTKLLQVCSGAVYTDTGDYAVVDGHRYTLIADLIDETDHSVVFFNWRHQRDLLAKEFDNRGYSYAVLDGNTPDALRIEIVRRFQNGEYKTLLMHPKTGAHGLTLTRGTLCVVASPIYEADLLKQMIHRIYRGGQTQVTNTVLVRASGTVEKLVYERLEDKTERMDLFLELATQRGRA